MKDNNQKKFERDCREVMANLIDTYYFVDKNDIIQEISESGVKAIGADDATEIIGRNIKDFYYNPKDRDQFMNELRQHGKWRAELVLKKLDGTPVIVETNSVIAYNSAGEVIGVEGILRDITERKRIETALKNSENKFRELFENISDSLTIFDFETLKFEDANRATLDLYGYTKEEYLKLNALDVSAEPQVTKESIIQNSKCSSWQKIPLRYHKKKDGAIFPVEITSGIFYIDGKKKVIGAVRDISERVKAQQKLIQAQKMDSIGNLAGGIAHDFNNMLGGIMGYISLLLEEETDEAKKIYLQKIANISNTAAELTKNLLAYGRREKSVTKPILLNNNIRDVLSIIRYSINKTIKITQDLEPDLWTIDGDPSQINQVLMNLVVNASEAINHNQGQITISTKNISLDNFPDKNFVQIKITDNGTGIPEKIKDKIFEPFFSTKKDTHKQGTGLGLATTYSIISNHQGNIEVESEINQGTTFIINFPQGKLNEGKKKKIKTDIKTNQKGKIFIIDDEQLIVDMLKIMLKKLGYEVLATTNSRQALQIFRENIADIDAVILDMNMPQMSGKEMFIKMKELDPNVRVLLSSGYGQSEEAQEILNLGAKDLLPKPYKISELAQKIQQVIMTKN